MATINIGGRRVKVGDEFLALSPEDQQRTVDEIASNLPGEERIGEATKRGFLRGASFDFLDELEGLARAGGLDPKDENVANAIKSLFVGGYRKFKGDPDAERLYKEQRDTARALSESLEEQHPGATIGGQLAGGLAVPFGAAAKVPTWLGRAKAAGTTGAVVGGLTGFGAGEDLGGSITGAAIGAPVGYAAGAALSPIVEGAVGLAGRAVEPVANTLRAAFNRPREAERRAGVAYVRDQKAGDLGLTEGEFAAEPAAALIDRFGSTGRALARSSATTSPEARGALTRMTSDRYEGQGARIADDLRAKYGDPDPVAMEAAAADAKRAANAPNYQRTYAEGDHPIWSPELERLTSSPKIQGAIEGAQAKWKDYAVADGFGAMNPPFRVDPGGLLTRTGGTGMKAYPNIQMWDYAARELQDLARAAPIGSETARLYNQLARRLKDELDKLVPSYKATRETAASFFNADNALEAGIKFLGSKETFSLAKARAALAKMSPDEQQLFRDGYTARFLEQLDKHGDRTNLLNRIATSKHAREELEVVYGKAGTDEILARLRVESVMDKMRAALGGSDTAQKLAEAGLAGGAVGILGGDYAGLGHLGGAGAGAAAGILFRKSAGAIGARIDHRVAQQVGELLASRDTEALARGIKMVVNSKTLQNIIEHADNAMARLGGQQAGEQVPPLLRQ